MAIAKSELILNEDGSIYHLQLKPKHLASTIITVGDPDRVDQVTQYFDEIEYKIHKREFHTQTGYYKGHRITVISTGIGTDNIDIVFNELDALVNIDFTTRKPKEVHTSLNIIRIGTSGSVQPNIPIDSFVISEIAVGFDSLLHFYDSHHVQLPDFSKALMSHLNWDKNKSIPYTVSWNQELGEKMLSKSVQKGVTITNVGFYGPQGRVLRLPLQDSNLNKKIASFEYNTKKITNLEMETAGIYGIAKLLGHKAVSMNAILANRYSGDFSHNPKVIIDKLIQYTLKKIIS
ncbi:nucleoside phosphorylase [Aquimarina muelleri]|uniref:Uridine phosphorylase n=1 Tax=Aquimarina muelleri TaxID=279356 RepID=A0A918JYD5_9FLAO|nr:nucleoside phosphorylase [Aquimarina muelleri]MCX2762910.1 nucleoside phosphorylase [Aquimarina muelleri]GGX27206.1 phosphorylase [Aquimarina muelleri]